MILADTDVLIDYLRNSGQAERVALELKLGKLATSVITAFELWTGVRNPIQGAAVETLLGAVKVIALDSKRAALGAELQRTLRAQGITVGMADSLIAGICICENAVLLTRNRKDFRNFPGLKISGDFE